MSPDTESRKRPSAPSKKESGPVSSTLVFRLIVASFVFVIPLLFELSKFIGIIVFAVSAIVAGYDVISRAVDSVECAQYFETPVVVTFITVIAFFIGFASEGAALILLYQIGVLLLNYAIERTKKSALELISNREAEERDRIKAILSDTENTHTSLEDVMRSSAGLILKLAMVIAVAYAVLLPIFTSYTYSISIHRALMIILIATPMSVTVSIPLCSYVGMCYSSSQGIMFSNAYSLEAVSDASVAVFDKTGIFAEETPHIIAMHSDKLDSGTFMNLLAHAVYYSDQPVAQAVSAAFDGEYQLELIRDFRDIPGCGVELSLDGLNVLFATRGVAEKRGVALPEPNVPAGTAYYMVVSGRCFGWIVVSTDVNQEAEQLIPALNSLGVSRCVLLTEDGKEYGRQFAETMGFSEMYPDCDGEKKLSVIEKIRAKTKGAILYIFCENMSEHSAATVDLRVTKKGKFTDGVIDPMAVNNIPFARQVAGRVRSVAVANAVFVFLIKSLLVFLSIIGLCNLWFAIFIDMAAAVAAVLISIRVTNESLSDTLRYKLGKQ